MKNLSQNVLKSDLKNPEFVPFGANLTHLGPKSGRYVGEETLGFNDSLFG